MFCRRNGPAKSRPAPDASTEARTDGTRTVVRHAHKTGTPITEAVRQRATGGFFFGSKHGPTKAKKNDAHRPVLGEPCLGRGRAKKRKKKALVADHELSRGDVKTPSA